MISQLSDDRVWNYMYFLTCTNTIVINFWFREIGFRAKFQRFYAVLYCLYLIFQHPPSTSPRWEERQSSESRSPVEEDDEGVAWSKVANDAFAD